MRDFLDGLLPRLFPGVSFILIPHEGKTDLERSIPRKIRGWRKPGARFIIVRDQDSADCFDLKKKLLALCSRAGRPDSIVRIACHELEGWYLGDLDAVADAFANQKLRLLAKKAKYRNPDAISTPSNVMVTLVPGFGKVSGARAMATHVQPDRNRSRSFQVFLRGIERAITEAGDSVATR